MTHDAGYQCCSEYGKMKAEIERLRAALEFYANPIRYRGSNQRNAGGDPFSGDDPYIKDVNRDGGGIARTALSSH